MCAVLMALSVFGSCALTAHATVLPSCAIQLTDLRRGYVAGSAGYTMTNMDALQYYASLAAYDSRLALVSYSSSFYLPQWPTYREIESSISLYASAGRAQTAYRQNLALIGRWHHTWSFTDRTGHHRVDERWRAMPAPLIGVETAAWLTETHDSRHAYSIAFVFFRRGLYLASVRAFGPARTLGLQQVLPLGRLIDRRIASVCALG